MLVNSALKRYLPRGAQTIDRRGFLNILSSSAILTAVPALPVDPPGLAGPSSRSRISLTARGLNESPVPKKTRRHIVAR